MSFFTLQIWQVHPGKNKPENLEYGTALRLTLISGQPKSKLGAWSDEPKLQQRQQKLLQYSAYVSCPSSHNPQPHPIPPRSAHSPNITSPQHPPAPTHLSSSHRTLISTNKRHQRKI
ncbi:hypothetical protein PGT21_033678 [Puccinia graminis f. sp. tritici]|uniref:Uncharacterized protein n=1 Tax=Puccinia graminis f. sp. tritici TaxID=56615 RepID=A0A5B0LN69_PUCGR|nr:hypothetical protein PGTUg99_015767 [Puccinia graminis f. sp. tritici]KAA1094968.1 hypothetical protein PGT21_033678 [Puccinia graminis f. sp. tritici]